MKKINARISHGKDSHKWGLPCLFCEKVQLENPYVKSLVEKAEEGKTPMGASQWKNHGKKWGYWDYFQKEAEEKVIEEVLELIKNDLTKFSSEQPEIYGRMALIGLRRQILETKPKKT